MTKAQCVDEMNARLRIALKSYHALPGMTQEKVAEALQIAPRSCSALENGEHGFSIFTAFGLLSNLPAEERRRLIADLCGIAARALRRAA